MQNCQNASKPNPDSKTPAFLGELSCGIAVFKNAGVDCGGSGGANREIKVEVFWAPGEGTGKGYKVDILVAKQG